MTVTFHVVDPDDPTLVAHAHRLWADSDQSFNPDDERIGLAEFERWLVTETSTYRSVSLIGIERGEGVVLGSFDIGLGSANPDYVDVDIIHVDPPHRGRGLGRSMVRFALDHFGAQGYAKATLWASDATGNAFCESLGLTRRTEERCSRLALAELDDDQQATWRRNDAAIDAGYRMVRIGERCPDDLIDAYCQAKEAMADQPLGDLDFTTDPVTVETVRSKEASRQDRGLQTFASLILAPDGSGAGLTELSVNTFRPSLAFQGDTGVVRAHRGHGLGRWLKAANLADARAAHPSLAVIETYNAEENPWMLAINVEMGFRPHRSWVGWGGDFADFQV